MKGFFLRHSKLLRRTSQFLSLILLFAIPLLNLKEIYILIGSYYSIDIFSYTITDPAMLIQTVLIGGKVTLAFFLSILLPLLIAALGGRLFCSWACPYNAFAELIKKLKNMLSRKSAVRVPHVSNRVMAMVLLAVLLLTFLSDIPLITFLSMPGLISSEIADSVFLGELGLEFAFISLFLVLDVFALKRVWCRYLCPVGALLSLLKNPLTLKIKRRSSMCAACDAQKVGVCHTVCPLDLDPRKEKNLYPSCYNCLDCVNSCQKHGSALIPFTTGLTIVNKGDIDGK